MDTEPNWDYKVLRGFEGHWYVLPVHEEDNFFKWCREAGFETYERDKYAWRHIADPRELKFKKWYLPYGTP